MIEVNEAACRQRIEDELAELGLPDDERDTLVSKLVMLCEVADSHRAPPGVNYLMLRRWVIRDDHVDLWAIVRKAGGAGALGHVAGPTALKLGVIYALVDTFKQGAMLSAPQAQVLSIVRRAEVAVDAQVIASELNRDGTFDDGQEWRPARVTEILESLNPFRGPRADHTIVRKTDEGWMQNGY